ncbi:rab3 GTPase-activating protein non-catalytic subunit [Phalaenopsis equestris]|uniref:rab3 GTPase-activating protein non-catalytic subunit n=1 Tax=Phalaenopsis equestris TaxID=78828 RepID=UPI0009E445EE|nr:rab3 GTPase-activating protein non-catalytic subunit [Phalaenopsis equestris]
MARRSHFTDLCCIACSELEDLGAGEREGWLSDPSLLATLHPQALALAHTSLSLLLLLPLDPSSSRRRTTVRPSLSAEEGRISAIEWLPFADLLTIALGSSAGFLLIYSLAGDLIHKQLVHPGRILRLRFREKRGESLLDAAGAAASSEELCVILPGVVARFDGSDIQSLFRRWLEEEGSRAWNNRFTTEDGDDSPYGRIPFQLWSVSKYGSCLDAAIVGIMPPPLLELQSSQRYYCAITVGENAVISAFRLSEDRNRSIVGAILSKVVPVTFSTLASFSKMIWRTEQSFSKNPRVVLQPFAKASPLTCLKDSPRKGEKLAVSPSGTLAAITDSLGRVLLLDTQALVVVRLWKGYREASCLFIEALINKDRASTSSNYTGQRKNDYSLCLAIHAPRKGIIEIWKMRTGPRLLTVPCPKGSIILQSSSRSVASNSSSYNPLEAFLLNGDSGQLSVLNTSIG